MANSHLQILCFVLLFTSFALTTTAANQSKLVLRLIHRDSVLSPFHNPKITTENNAIMPDESSSPSDDIRAPLIPERRGTLFFVNVSIGEPPLPQLLAMDTGSPITWICTKWCHPELNPLFVPKRSSTYKNISCFHPKDCKNYSSYAECGQNSLCSYHMRYGDGSSTQGLLASEKFTFVTSSGGTTGVPDIVFGVGLDNRGNARTITGILGLEPDNQHSLVSRVGNKFSYCIGNISDPYYMYNQLILGDGAIFEGSSTPMMYTKGRYLVKLEGISVGQKQLTINKQEFDFNVLIDSGTTITVLRRSGFDALKEEVDKLLGDILERAYVSNSGESPCYYGNLVRDLKRFPFVSLRFAGGAELVLGVEGLFRRVDNYIFCMAVDVSRGDLNIIGVRAQQYYNVGFDLDAMKVSFQYIDCQLLE